MILVVLITKGLLFYVALKKKCWKNWVWKTEEEMKQINLDPTPIAICRGNKVLQHLSPISMDAIKKFIFIRRIQLFSSFYKITWDLK